MKRSLVITGAVAVFAASTALSIVVADSLQEERRTVLPTPAEGVGAAVLTESVTGLGEGEELATDELPADAFDAGYVSLLPTTDAATEDVAAPTVGDAYPWPTDGDTGTGTEADESGGDSGGTAGGTGAVDIERLGAELLGSPSAADAYASRFVDLCAESPGSPLCPTGVGGTVLVPFDGESSYGEFDVYTISGTPSPMWDCKVPSELEADEYPVLVNATHPARIEIEYHPVDDPTDRQTVVVDLTDPEIAVVSEFTAYVAEHGTVPSEGVHHCFVLRSSPGHRSYMVSGRGTSFTGETDVLVQRVDFHPRRPAVIVTPQIDEPLKAAIGVPVAVDPEERAVVRMLRVNDGQTCAAIEDDMLAGESDRVVPVPGWGQHDRRMSWGDTFVPAPPGWAADVYDVDAWSVNLEESTDYVLCVWWLRSPTRSFDPAHLSITDRETRLVTTPDMMRTYIGLDGVEAGDEGFDAGAVSVTVPNGCNPRAFAPVERRVPSTPVQPNEYHSLHSLELCEYPGISQPAATRVVITGPGLAPKEFEVPTPHRTDRPYVQAYNLYFGPSSCLSGVSFDELSPDCEARLPRGPTAALYVGVESGPSNGLTEWLITEGQEFDAPDRAPEALPIDIRIDLFHSSVETIDRDSLRVAAYFDRPVTLSASLEGNPCVLSAEPSYSITTLRSRHTFVLDGLCTLTGYAVRLEASDGTTTTSFSALADQWFGYGQTDGYHVTYTVSAANITWDPRRLYKARWSVRIDPQYLDHLGNESVQMGEPVALGVPSRCLAPARSEPMETVWGETVQIEAQVWVWSAEIVGRGYCERRREGGHGDFVFDAFAEISIEELMEGPVVFTLGNPSGGATIDLVVQASFE